MMSKAIRHQHTRKNKKLRICSTPLGFSCTSPKLRHHLIVATATTTTPRTIQVKPMQNNSTLKLRFKAILIALAGIAAAVLGILAVGFCRDYFNAHPLNAVFMLSGSLGIDIFGALIPLTIAVFLAVTFLRFSDFPMRKLAISLAASVSVCFLISRLTTDGVASASLLFALITSVIVAGVNVLPNLFANLRKNFQASLLLSAICVPISLLTVDLYYASSFSGAVIGGVGLSDGVMVSTLYAPLGCAIVFSVLAYLFQMASLITRSRVTSHAQIKPRSFKAPLSELQNTQSATNT
jgi:hypothetical protein